jgi:hypothetical protein
MIEAIVGNPGAGKSLYAVIRAMRALRQGRMVYSNLYPRWPDSWRWGNWLTMKDAGEGLFIVDEAQVWFGSRTFAQNTSELHNWQQSRKRGADLIWIAQHENRVDTAIRELTSVIWRPKILGPIMIIKSTTMEGERLGVDFAFHKAYRGAYHTDQIIGAREDTRALLARVNNPIYMDPPLYVAAPSHCILLAESGRVEYVQWYETISAECYFYEDYSGTRWALEVDEHGYRVNGRVSSPEAEWVRTLRQAYARRGPEGVAQRVRQAVIESV